jgi:pilus assembly protein CpaB
MNGKSMMMLGLAIAFGLGAMVLTRQMLGQEAVKVQEEAQDVLVAARDIKEEELLKPETVKVIRMAKSAVPVGAFSAPKDVEDRWVKTSLLEGDVVIEKKLGIKGTPPGLVANIPKGMRAFAIDVTEQSGVSGFILPGHRVDVIRFEAERGEHRGESILQDILVLAAGQVFTRAEERSLTNRTVTLALTPEQVDILVAARAKGALSLALRGVNDHDVVARPKPQPQQPSEEEKRRKLEEENRRKLEEEKRKLEEENRRKLEEENRRKLEQELAEIKAALAAAKAVPPPAPPRPRPRYVAIYRGREGRTDVLLDGNAGAEPVVSRPAALPGLDVFDRPLRPGTGPGRGAGLQSQAAEAAALIGQADGPATPDS